MSELFKIVISVLLLWYERGAHTRFVDTLKVRPAPRRPARRRLPRYLLQPSVLGTTRASTHRTGGGCA